MLGKINGMYLQGMDGVRILVEADVSDGLPGYSLVGYLASETRESQDRVRTAIKNLNLSLQPKKVTINLSPADIRKEGTGFDLPIAVAILIAHGLIPQERLEGAVLIGELGLDGSVKGVPGILALAAWARQEGYRRMLLPAENLAEASVVGGIRFVPVRSLEEAVDILRGKREEPTAESVAQAETRAELRLNEHAVDFSEVNGQPVLRRAAEVAAAGRHNLLMIGPAGSGKTMVAKRMPTILPDMDLEESIEISKIYSICSLLSQKEPLIRTRPFRAPHHTISAQALAGGGTRPKPGEISLASGGILFLDELPEMAQSTIDLLRQPLEEHSIRISRVFGSVCYPASFQLVAAMNPCKCGHYPDLSRCTCTLGQIKRYLSKVSRPLLDRIDICVEAAAVSYEDLAADGHNESSAEIRSRVEAARAIQARRYEGTKHRCNSEMTGAMVKRFCILSEEEEGFMRQVFEDMKLSARMHDKLLKVARTIADLDGRGGPEDISHRDLCEAISYVRVREKYWG